MVRCRALLLLVGCLVLLTLIPWPLDNRSSASMGKRGAEGTRRAWIDSQGDPLPPGAVARLGSLRRWRGAVQAVAFSPDGGLLASGGDEGLVHLRHLPSGRDLAPLRGLSKTVLCLAFAPDGRTLAAAGGGLDSQESPVLLWDVNSGKELRRFRSNWGEVFALAFSADGTTLVAGSHTVHRWEVATGQELPFVAPERPGGDVAGVACSPDGRALAVVRFPDHLFLYDLPSGQSRRLAAKSPTYPCIAFTPDGKVLGSAGGDSLHLWEVATGKELGTVGGGVHHFAFAPDGRTAAWGNREGAVHQGEVATGLEAPPFTGHRDEVTCLAYSPDGRTLASGSADGTVLLWDAQGGLRDRQPRRFTLSAWEANNAEQEEPAPVPENVRVSLQFEQRPYFLGENIHIGFCVENTGGGVFYIHLGGDYRGASRARGFSVKAVDAEGHEVDDPDPSGFCMGGISYSEKMIPGAKHTESLPLMRYRRFEKPGVYRLQVVHGLGWTETGGRRSPVAEGTISLVMPTETQARAVVQEMGRQRQPDFSTLAYPVYLPILAARAAEGDDRALAGLGQMPTVEATEVLIRLLDHQDPQLARKALQTLNLRLPDPQLEGNLPGRNFWINDREAQRRWLVQRSWRADLAPGLRQVGRRLLTQEDPESLECGAYLLECLGEQEDLAALVHALDRAAVQARDMPLEKQVYPCPRGACRELLRAARALSQRGVQPPMPPRSPGEMILFATALGTAAQFRPRDWETTYAGVLRHELPYVREVGLDNLPLPVAPSLLALLPGLLADDNVDVQIAACRAAGKSKAAALREPVLRTLATAREEWLLHEANNAAYDLGTGTDRLRVLVDRLDEGGMTARCLKHLVSSVLSDLSCYAVPNDDMLDVTAGRACKAAWLRFLRLHEEELQAGKRFSLADPAVPLQELFPRFQFDRR